MKIVEVKTYSPVYPVKDPFSNAMRTTRERAFGIVEVITDAGITGWGEGASVPARPGNASRRGRKIPPPPASVFASRGQSPALPHPS